MLKTHSFFAFALLLAAGCGGGGNATPAAIPTVAPTIAPDASPTPHASATPSASPSASASPVATATPTIAPALKVIGGAPLTATASQLSNARRNAQAKTQAQGVTNGIPILIESSGQVASIAGTQVTWVTNAQTSQDIPETGGTVTPSGNLPISNPGFMQACIGSLAPACIVHPTAWEYGTSSTNGKPVGMQTITIAFADGTTGTTADYIYDGWQLPCNTGWAYVSGVPVAQATLATSDIYADCVNGNIDTPLGAFILSQPSPDQYGITATIMPTLTAQPLFAASNGIVPMSAIANGTVLAINARDGGFAKVLFTGTPGVPGNPAGIAALGMSLHSQTNGAFAF